MSERPGLSLETASSIIARDVITKHLAQFHHVIRHDRAANTGTAAAYIDGLAGVIALTVRGGFGSKDEIIDACIAKLRDAVERDLRAI